MIEPSARIIHYLGAKNITVEKLKKTVLRLMTLKSKLLSSYDFSAECQARYCVVKI